MTKKSRLKEPSSKPEKSLYAVIMAGGKGTRFWPISRESFPKQFLRLTGDRTLIQDTMHRLRDAVRPSNFLIITTEAQKDIVHWQIKDVSDGAVCVIEPEGKNTAPAIALAAFKLFKKEKDALMFVLPSDHYIEDERHFLDTLRRAVPVAKKGRIVTFGIRPSRPETGYGYIKAGKAAGKGVYEVSRFVEKPDARKAADFVREGSYFWNSGMFLFRARDIIGEIKKYMPETYAAFKGITSALNTGGERAALEQVYGRLPDISIDYGVMEKSKKASVVSVDFVWSDIGSWSALDEMLKRDGDGNVVVGNVVATESSNSIFFADKRLIAAIGLRNMVVVDTSDATLICPKGRVQQVKGLVSRLKEEGKEEYLSPKIEERPWGFFSVLEKGDTYQIKHIYVKPGGRLSLQMHNHRSEHWIVVSGTAKVQRGEEVFYVHKNESTYIPPTMKHRLENPGLIPLKIIEIQSGEHLGEDDIVRFKDVYGRGK